MCPFCSATLGLIVASATSAGGLAALAMKISRKKDDTGKNFQNSMIRRNEDVYEHSRASESSVE
jgi:hypothetical protein